MTGGVGGCVPGGVGVTGGVGGFGLYGVTGDTGVIGAVGGVGYGLRGVTGETGVMGAVGGCGYTDVTGETGVMGAVGGWGAVVVEPSADVWPTVAEEVQGRGAGGACGGHVVTPGPEVMTGVRTGPCIPGCKELIGTVVARFTDQPVRGGGGAAGTRCVMAMLGDMAIP